MSGSVFHYLTFTGVNSPILTKSCIILFICVKFTDFLNSASSIKWPICSITTSSCKSNLLFTTQKIIFAFARKRTKEQTAEHERGAIAPWTRWPHSYETVSWCQ